MIEGIFLSKREFQLCYDALKYLQMHKNLYNAQREFLEKIEKDNYI